MHKPKWYGVRTVYEHTDRRRGQDRMYEERVVLVRAATAKEAIAKAEEEAQRYSTEGTRYLGYAVSFEMFEEPGEGVEVFSLLRNNRREPGPYLDSFLDTGRERTRDVEDSGTPPQE